MDEAEFIAAVSMVAQNHNCKVLEIDFRTKLFQIACPKGSEVNCAAELEEVLKEYCEDDDGIETLMGWPI